MQTSSPPKKKQSKGAQPKRQEHTCLATEKMRPALGTVINEGNEFIIRRRGGEINKRCPTH